MGKSIGATLKLKDGNFFANLKKASKELGTFDSKTSDSIKTLQGFGNSFKSAKSPVDSLKNSVIGFVSTYASLSAIKGIGRLSDEMSQTKARLDMVNDGLQTNEELNSMIFKSAKDSRGQYKATADLVTSLGNNCGAVFKTTKETVAFAEQLNKRFAIAGAGPEAASNAITQLSQGLAAGALRGDELNSVLEQAPNIARSIEAYMGIAQGSIKKAAEEGLVTADVVKNAILSSADETNAQFEKMPMTWGQIWQNIKTTTLEKASPILDTINKVANGEQFQDLVTKVTDGIGQLAENGTIDKFANGIMTAADKAIEAIPKIVGKIGEAVGFIKEHWGVISGIAGGIAGAVAAFKGVKAIIGVVSTISKVVQAFSVLKKALGIGKIISIAFSGPVGIVITLVGGLIVGIVALWKNCEGFRNGVKKVGEGIKNVFAGIGKVVSSVFGAAKETVSEKLSNIKQAYEENGGGIKGIAAAGWEAIKGYYTAGFDFLNKLTGGKLEGIKNAFSKGFEVLKEIPSKGLDAMKTTVSNRLNKIKKAFEDNGGGLKGAAFAAWEGIKGYYTDGFNFVNNLTDGKLGELLKKFKDGFKPIIDEIQKGWEKLTDWWNKVWGIEVTPTADFTSTERVVGTITPSANTGTTLGITPDMLTRWNAAGGIFRKPTVLSTNSGLQGFGEAGAEAVLPLTQFWNNLRKYLTERTINETTTKTNDNKFYITVHADGKSVDEIIDEFVPKLKLKLANL